VIKQRTFQELFKVPGSWPSSC